MAGSEFVPLITIGSKTLNPRSGLLYGFVPPLAALPRRHHHALKPLASGFGRRRYFFDVEEDVGIADFLAEIFEKRINSSKNKHHFAAAARLKKQLFVYGAAEDEGRGHIPIASNLPEPGVFLGARGVYDFQKVVSILRPEFRRKPASRLAHFGFAAEIVEFQNYLCIMRSRVFRHLSPLNRGL